MQSGDESVKADVFRHIPSSLTSVRGSMDRIYHRSNQAVRDYYEYTKDWKNRAKKYNTKLKADLEGMTEAVR